ncbi:MAG: CHC2 zinc finger domain-containing protein, partial [Pyrinomonadaceae bacterium]
MARIAEEEIERLKREVSLERLIEARGVRLTRRGKNLFGRCPFGTHSDTEPSFVVTPAKNLWHCFGCQEGGDVIAWVMRAEGVSFRHAVELLRSTEYRRSTEYCVLGTESGAVNRNSALSTQNSGLSTVISYYHETLKQSPEVLAYLERRGLQSAEMIERFRLGYGNRTLAYRLPAKNRIAGAEIRSRLQELGILRESGHEHFNGSLVIPVIDEQGAVTEVYGRKIRDNLRPGTVYHLYLPGAHKGVWNIEALQASTEIILCEALIDALTFWCAGYRNVTASYGVEGFTEDHMEAFKRYQIERVLIAYDRDEAGERAANRLAEKLIGEGIGVYRIHFPKGMDANEYALKVKPAEKSLGLLIRSAQWIGGGTGSAGVPPAREAEPHFSVGERVSPSQRLAAHRGGTAASLAAKEETAEINVTVEAEESLPSLAAVADDFKSEALPASPLPPAPSVDVPVEINGEEIIMCFGDRRYRVRGLQKNLSFEQMKVNIRV